MSGWTESSSSSPVLIGFGKNYYHNFGPTKQFQRKHISLVESEEEKTSPIHVSSYQFHNDDENEQPEQQQSQPLAPWDQEDDPLIDVTCTIASTYFLTRSGKIYSCGTIHGQVRPSLTKLTIPLPLKCVQLATGRHFCLARMEGGLAVCAWGAGHFGQLGLGGGYDDAYGDGSRSSSSGSPPSFVHRPTVIEDLLPHMVGAPISSISAGYWHSMALTKEGSVYCWGCNRNAQCGRKPSTKDPPTICQPQRVLFDNSGNHKRIKIHKIAAGRSHSLVLDEGGQCYTWGANQYGQCGILSRRRIGGVASPKHVEALAKVKIVDISAGNVHTLALTGGGRVFGWGGGFEGQLGTGYIYQMNPKPKLVSDLDFVAIEASQEYKAKIKEKQSTTSTTTTTTTKVTDTSTTSANGSRVSTLDSIPKIVSVKAKGNSSFAISSVGHVYAWGCNDVGNLGLPKPDSSTLTYSDPGQIGQKTTSIQRQFQTYSFDSSHNIALPQRLDSLRDYEIHTVGASSTFCWYLGTKREGDGPIGRTLYEVQELKQKNKSGQQLCESASLSSGGDSASKREKNRISATQKEEKTRATLEKKTIIAESDATGWKRTKKAPPLPPVAASSRSKPFTTSSSSMEFLRSFRNSEQEEPSQAFSVASTFDRRSSGSTPGRKKRLFSPKKLVRALVRRASGTHKASADQSSSPSLPTIDLDKSK